MHDQIDMAGVASSMQFPLEELGLHPMFIGQRDGFALVLCIPGVHGLLFSLFTIIMKWSCTPQIWWIPIYLHMAATGCKYW